MYNGCEQICLIIHYKGRWDSTGPELMRLQDRHEQDFCLGPTHEEIFTSLIADEAKSWKEFPMALYQIGKKVLHGVNVDVFIPHLFFGFFLLFYFLSTYL